MRKILGFSVVLAAAYMAASVGVAHGQAGAGGQAGRGTSGARAAGTVVNDVEQQAAQAAGLRNPATTAPTVPGRTSPAIPGQATPAIPGQATPAVPGQATPAVPGQATDAVPSQATGAIPGQATGAIPGQVTDAIPGRTTVGSPAPGISNTTRGNTVQTPGPTAPAGNPAGATTAYPGTATNYSSSYYQAGAAPGSNTGATPGYTNRAIPGPAGSNAVNPTATTMAPGYYSTGTAGMPYVTYTNTGYAPTYANPTYYTVQPSGARVQQRRGLFGGLFRRRNRVTYPAITFGRPNAPAPYGYSGYPTTTYYTVPGTYVYGTSPY